MPRDVRKPGRSYPRRGVAAGPRSRGSVETKPTSFGETRTRAPSTRAPVLAHFRGVRNVLPRDAIQVHGRRARRAARPPRPGRDPRRRRDAPRGAPRRELLRLRQVRRRAKPAVAPRPSRRHRSQSVTRCKKQHDRTSARAGTSPRRPSARYEAAGTSTSSPRSTPCLSGRLPSRRPRARTPRASRSSKRRSRRARPRASSCYGRAGPTRNGGRANLREMMMMM